LFYEVNAKILFFCGQRSHPQVFTGLSLQQLSAEEAESRATSWVTRESALQEIPLMQRSSRTSFLRLSVALAGQDPNSSTLGLHKIRALASSLLEKRPQELKGLTQTIPSNDGDHEEVGRIVGSKPSEVVASRPLVKVQQKKVG
jgi:hypothetical protein